MLLRQDHFVLVQDPLEHTKVTPIREEVSNIVQDVRCFAFQPGAQSSALDRLLSCWVHKQSGLDMKNACVKFLEPREEVGCLAIVFLT